MQGSRQDVIDIMQKIKVICSIYNVGVTPYFLLSNLEKEPRNILNRQ